MFLHIDPIRVLWNLLLTLLFGPNQLGDYVSTTTRDNV